MAIQTYELVRMDGGAFVASYDYDDVTLRVQTIRAVNTGTRDYTISATVTANGITYAVTVQPGATIEQPVPQGVANRLQLTLDSAGRLRGATWRAR